MYKIEYKFTSLNSYINAERTNRYKAAAIKKRETRIAYLSFKGKEKIDTPCRLKFTWLIKDKRRDLDNIGYAKKYILDGMVKAGIIENDGLNQIIGLQDEYIVCDTDGVIVEVIE